MHTRRYVGSSRSRTFPRTLSLPLLPSAVASASSPLLPKNDILPARSDRSEARGVTNATAASALDIGDSIPGSSSAPRGSPATATADGRLPSLSALSTSSLLSASPATVARPTAAPASSSSSSPPPPSSKAATASSTPSSSPS